ncbi:G-type lectin S-receptor-like serine/threonine-protein kinase LECRK3 [Juglans microcarpa x Juglans regia]|uniref:G-type lectin S-receptor-like serine/threonine-protein kinase LECRK3 n=1 Tax=Juglans microcarpa x Juglans regia TaxID=2249226 RepID=UPI001B7EDA05|nr:G-type lectin S-receptor-like serine/threonine-protein kinase LECRK3 [Juglans microcarpa x Juglans regia]
MVSIFLYLLLITGFSAAIAQQRNSSTSLGSSLSPNANPYWLSDSGQFAFGFYKKGDGFAIGIWLEKIRQKTVVWTANLDNPPLSRNVTLLLTNDGRLVLEQEQGQQTALTNALFSASYASMLDTGNFVLYNSSSNIIWQTFDAPTDTILPGQPLLAGNKLFSSSSETNHARGKFQLIMQHDGNLVQYPSDIPPKANDYAYWDSKTFDAGDNISLNLGRNGQLSLINHTGFSIKNLNGQGNTSHNFSLYRLTLDFDGILRLYSHGLNQDDDDWSIEWSPSSSNCDPIGLCGLNAYCTVQEQKAVCTCPPGFDFLDRGQPDLGCKRNSSTDGCTSKNGETVDTLQELESFEWEDNPYSTLSLTKTECRDDCLKDCECEAALFKDQHCRKQKLPLRYGRKRQGNASTTIFKVRFGSSNTTQVSKGRKKQQGMGVLIGSSVILVFALIVLAFSAFLVLRYRLWSYKKVHYEVNEGLVEDVSLRVFTYSQLEVATNGFVELLGRGSFGTVFKGALSNGQMKIAVKRLEKVVAEGDVEFRNEMRSIGRTHHRNLVRLLGYCHDDSNRLLVYEYMSNGTLSNYLFRSQIKPNWEERTKISLNIARGILYLHEECEIHIIHCDLNPNNILMDEQGCAKIADFGLAKLLMPDHSRTLTGIRGTRGYVAPEWHKNLPITVKADVYSFGVVFLVIICCRRSIDVNAPEEEAILVNWVYDCFKANEVSKLVPEEVDQQSLERMIRIGLWCIEEDPAVRPPIKKVVQMLEGTVEIPEPPCAQSSFLH